MFSTLIESWNQWKVYFSYGQTYETFYWRLFNFICCIVQNIFKWISYQNLLIEKVLRGVIIELAKTRENFIATFQSRNFQEIQNSIDDSLNHQARLLRNFVKMFEYLLLFIKATRQQMSELYLVSLHALEAVHMRKIIPSRQENNFNEIPPP